MMYMAPYPRTSSKHFTWYNPWHTCTHSEYRCVGGGVEKVLVSYSCPSQLLSRAYNSDTHSKAPQAISVQYLSLCVLPGSLSYGWVNPSTFQIQVFSRDCRYGTQHMAGL